MTTTRWCSCRRLEPRSWESPCCTPGRRASPARWPAWRSSKSSSWAPCWPVPDATSGERTLPEICLQDVVASHGDLRVLDGVSLRVRDKEFVTLLGPSGCGKTTTLMVMAGFHQPDAGRITCGDEVFFDRV